MRGLTHRPGVLAAVALAAVLAPASCARAAGGSALLHFHLPASHRYLLVVRAVGPTVTLTAVKAHHARDTGSQTSYIARRGPGSGAIRSTFGELGAVAMRFHPSGPPTQTAPQRNCIGPDHYTIRKGVFVGTFRFRGEDGYTAVDARRVKGKSISPPSLACFGPQGGGGGGRSGGDAQHAGPAFQLEAGFRAGLLARFFTARSGRAGQARYRAVVEQTQGRLAIYRIAIATGSPRGFLSDDALSFATLEPPPPFSGTGMLRRKPSGAPTWEGSLSVSFPGAPHVPLTGSPFKTRLTRAW